MVYLVTSYPASSFREHVFQADAFLHGHTYLWTAQVAEANVINNRAYIVHPPLADVVMVPSVLVQGVNQASQQIISILIGAVCALLVFRLTANLWLTAFFAFGTIVWYESILGAQWGFCLVLSCVPTLCALIGIKEHWNPLYIGAMAGLAFLARYDLALALPIYLCMVD